jgi:DNA polymerase-3 subunit beta
MLKMELDRESILRPLMAVSGVVERKNALPILSNVLLQGRGGMLSCLATDLEIQITAASRVDGALPEFATTVAARKLLDICRSLPEKTRLTLTQEKEQLLIRAGKSRFRLQTLPAGDYPRMGESDAKIEALTLTQGRLKGMLQQVQFAMAQQDIRFYLNGVLMQSDGDKTRFVATDGHRLSYVSAEGLRQGEDRTEVILPRKTVQELLKLLDDSEDPVRLLLSSNQAQFEFDDMLLVSKVIDHKFPDYERVIPKGHEKKFLVNRDQLLQALQRTAILSNEKFRGVRMVLTSNNLRVISTNNEQEEAEEDIEIEYSHEPMDIGFNIGYLQDVLNHHSVENLEFSLGDPSSSMMVTIPGREDYIYVVMPMRV